MAKTTSMIELLVVQLDECFSGHAWHGASLFTTLKGLTLRQALHESADGYSAWKVTLHCAYWKYRVWKKLVEAAGGSPKKFERSPADWPRLPAVSSDEHWRADLAFLRRHHEQLREAVLGTPPSFLGRAYNREGDSYHRLISGVAAHDAYHTAHVRNLGIPRLK